MRTRTRKERIAICFTEEELESLNNKVKKTGLSREAFCRKVLDGTIISDNKKDVSAMIQELRSISRDLTQIAQESSREDSARLLSVLSDLEIARQRILAAYTPEKSTDLKEG